MTMPVLRWSEMSARRTSFLPFLKLLKLKVSCATLFIKKELRTFVFRRTVYPERGGRTGRDVENGFRGAKVAGEKINGLFRPCFGASVSS